MDTDSFRKLIVLLAEEGISYSEISNFFGVSLNVVKNISSNRTKQTRRITLEKILDRIPHIQSRNISPEVNGLCEEIIHKNGNTDGSLFYRFMSDFSKPSDMIRLTSNRHLNLHRFCYSLSGNGLSILKAKIEISRSKDKSEVKDSFVYKYYLNSENEFLVSGVCWQNNQQVVFFGAHAKTNNIFVMTSKVNSFFQEKSNGIMLTCNDIGNVYSTRFVMVDAVSLDRINNQQLKHIAYSDASNELGASINLLKNPFDEYAVNRS